MKIILIGFMGSGKSCVAKELSFFLNFPIIEMDELVYSKTNTKNMHEVFAKGGERLLRITERAIAEEYRMIDNRIISTGGGVVLDSIVMDCFKQSKGKIFFLKASFQTLVDRLLDDTSRPLFKDHLEAKSLYLTRQPLYLNYADQVIEVDKKSVKEIAQEIAENSREYLKLSVGDGSDGE